MFETAQFEIETAQFDKESLLRRGAQASTPLLDKESLLRRASQGGFTLIELLIVIVILAILAAIVVFAVGSTTKNAVAAACSSDAKTVETAASAYQAQNGAITDTGTTMASWYAVLTGTGGGSVYLRAMPSSTHYTIFFTTTGAVYVLPYSASYTPTTAAAAEVNTLVSGAPAATNNNFDTNPSICSSFT